MSGAHSSGKGDKPRPRDKKKYSAGYDRIFKDRRKGPPKERQK